MTLHRYADGWTKTFKNQTDLFIYLRGCICNECYMNKPEILDPAICTIHDLLNTSCGSEYVVGFEDIPNE